MTSIKDVAAFLGLKVPKDDDPLVQLIAEEMPIIYNYTWEGHLATARRIVASIRNSTPHFVSGQEVRPEAESVRDKLWLWIDQAGRGSHVHIPTEDIRKAASIISALIAEVSKLKIELAEK